MTIGIVVVASLAAKLAGEPEATITSTFSATSSAASTGEPIVAVLREPVRDDDILALDVAELAQSLEQALDEERPALARADRHKTDPGCFRGLLAARHKTGYDQGQSVLQKPPTTMTIHATCRSRTLQHHEFSDAERHSSAAAHRAVGCSEGSAA
jgi:hypothetical protein